MSQTEEPNEASVLAGPDALKALLNASALLLASSDVAAVLSGILDVSRQVISADAYAVWRTFDGLTWRAVAAQGLSPSYRIEITTQAPVDPPFEAIPDVTTPDLLRQYGDVYRAQGVRSMLVVPLKLQTPVPGLIHSGTITFYWRTPRRFSDLDLAFSSALANLSATALNLSELQEQNRREKRRLAFLAEASIANPSNRVGPTCPGSHRKHWM